MATETKSNLQTSGVQTLIDRLRDEGVASGQTEAERLVGEARVEAMKILDQAQADAEAILAKARTEAAAVVENGNEALRLASRDVVLKVREACYEEFKNRLNRLIKHKLSDQRLLEQMILELATDARPGHEKTQTRLLLPQAHITDADLQKELADVQPGSLAAFVLGLTADVLREGLSFGISDDPTSTGVTIQIVEDDVQLELSDETITTVLLQYLVPRYRAVMKKDN
jgi:V/A-type H+/Na+-transporting ATPase subunit E